MNRHVRTLLAVCAALLCGACADTQPWKTPPYKAQYEAAQLSDPAALRQRWGAFGGLTQGQWLGFNSQGRLFAAPQPRWIIPGVVLETQLPFFGLPATFVYHASSAGYHVWLGDNYATELSFLPDGSLGVGADKTRQERLIYDAGKNRYILRRPDGTEFLFLPVTPQLFAQAQVDLATVPPELRWSGTGQNAEQWARVYATGGSMAPAPAAAERAPASAPPATTAAPAADDRYASLAASYNDKALDDVANAQTWLACASVAGKLSSGPAAQARQHARQVSATLRKLNPELKKSPCPDVITAELWQPKK